MSPVRIGDATLYLGDCMEILPTLPDFDLVLTDPPYGIGESSRKNATRGKPFGGKPQGRNTRGTAIPPTDYGHYDWDQRPPTATDLAALIEAGQRAILWGGNFFALPASGKWLVWDKINSGDFADCELAWTNLKGAARIFRHMWNGMLRDSERGTPRVHPTQKPILLMAWCLDQAGEVSSVLDPYMGSGTSGIACIQRGLSFTGVEREPRYFDIACKRIEAAYAQGRLFEEPKPDPEQSQIFGDAA